MGDNYAYHRHLAALAAEDAAFLIKKDLSYGGSWKKGGGRSAWFMLRRKMDRLIQMMRRPDPPDGWSYLDMENVIPGPREPNQDVTVDASIARFLLDSSRSEDVFLKIEDAPGGQDGTVLAEIRDLRRYLLLVEAEMVARGVVGAAPTPDRRCEWAPGIPSGAEE